MPAITIIVTPCSPDEHDCCTPLIAPGEYSGFFQRSHSSRYHRAIINSFLVPIRLEPSGSYTTQHLKTFACEFISDHGSGNRPRGHYAGDCPSGPIWCTADRVGYTLYDPPVAATITALAPTPGIGAAGAQNDPR